MELFFSPVFLDMTVFVLPAVGHTQVTRSHSDNCFGTEDGFELYSWVCSVDTYIQCVSCEGFPFPPRNSRITQLLQQLFT